MNDATPNEQPPLTLAEERAAAAARRNERFEEALKRTRMPESYTEWQAMNFRCGRNDPARAWQEDRPIYKHQVP